MVPKILDPKKFKIKEKIGSNIFWAQIYAFGFWPFTFKTRYPFVKTPIRNMVKKLFSTYVCCITPYLAMAYGNMCQQIFSANSDIFLILCTLYHSAHFYRQNLTWTSQQSWPLFWSWSSCQILKLSCRLSSISFLARPGRRVIKHKDTNWCMISKHSLS